MRKFLVSATFTFVAFAGAGVANAQTATQDVNISATVASYCTINNLTTGTVINATIPVTNGVVTTTPISNTVASIACNNVADVIATSQSGGVTTGSAAPTGTTNTINYTGTATFDGVTSTINTATIAGVGAAEAGNTATTASAATGNLVVAITPAQPALPLAPASYSDILRVTMTAH